MQIQMKYKAGRNNIQQDISIVIFIIFFTKQKDKFKDISEAYNILSKVESREQYDSVNGLRSAWKYDKTDNKFTDNEQYEEFLKEEQKEKQKMDEQAFDYFDKKYFSNRDYFKKNVIDDNEYELTMKLYKQHKQEVTEKKKDYVEFHPFTDSNYYVHKDVEAQAEKDNTVGGLLNDFKFPLIILICAIVGVGVFNGTQRDEGSIQTVKKSSPIKEGAGNKGVGKQVNIA